MPLPVSAITTKSSPPERHARRVALVEGSTESTVLVPPLDYIAIVRAALLTIDLDPCSSDAAQDRIGAQQWFTAADHRAAAAATWSGRVFLHPHPLAAVARGQIQKLLLHYLHRQVSGAVLLLQNPDFLRTEPLLLSFPFLFHYNRLTQSRLHNGELIPHYPSSNTLTVFLPPLDEASRFDAAAIGRFQEASLNLGRLVIGEDLGQDWQQGALLATRRMRHRPLLTETRINRHG